MLKDYFVKTFDKFLALAVLDTLPITYQVLIWGEEAIFAFSFWTMEEAERFYNASKQIGAVCLLDPQTGEKKNKIHCRLCKKEIEIYDVAVKIRIVGQTKRRINLCKDCFQTSTGSGIWDIVYYYKEKE